jgi:hypothetical protein
MTESSVVSPTAVLELMRISSRLDPWTVRAAATLRLPDLVAEGADTTSELAARSGTDPDALGRLMRHLTLLGLFCTTADGRWELAELGELLRDGHPMSMRNTLDQDDHFVPIYFVCFELGLHCAGQMHCEEYRSCARKLSSVAWLVGAQQGSWWACCWLVRASRCWC